MNIWLDQGVYTSEKASTFIEEIKTKEVSVQTDENDDDICKNAQKIFLIKKREKIDSIILSKYIPIILLMAISIYFV